MKNLLFVLSIFILLINPISVTVKADTTSENIATFAAGCFWHEEALFESLKGVNKVISGYAGGVTKNPTYEQVETGKTGHTETVNISYNPKVISYQTLLKLYFAGQDPTQVNGQGPDKGTQYRSIIFYRNNTEKQLVENYIKQLNSSGKYKSRIAVQVIPYTQFWTAEDYHQNYIVKNPHGGYVQNYSIPEVRKVQKQFPSLIKANQFF
jgi:peptide-methionine (S)-S-oxide reductase